MKRRKEKERKKFSNSLLSKFRQLRRIKLILDQTERSPLSEALKVIRALSEALKVIRECYSTVVTLEMKIRKFANL